ncbi:Nop14-like protein [Lophiostoma macrostomum CBS 122681]|uniref:Nop14-like protein n=1 Tax=Lophiostoma macrostomum CBS 122681 TaxID=1314788 RepID=A0A6A6TU25_9PLEO|nr:Nop14-like protein [Lophiostoma macrostomum CBS 122681]
MPPSQLKRLKASLREQGITGAQKSKKQKKQKNNDAPARAQKATALASIREASNPFDFKSLARPKKFAYTTNQPQDARKILGRPGVTKSKGEETRRKTLLPEMSKRNKVGGILDRRIGENDPSMSLDDRNMARFEREQQRKRGGNVFDLEEADDEVELTHGGMSLNFDENGAEDYDAASVSGSSEGGEDHFLKLKRARDEDEEEEAGEADKPERKKTKKEVMEEVIAKSKQHKYERQQLKEDDDELRETLDKDLPDVLAALRGHLTKNDAAPPKPIEKAPEGDFGMNPERAALLAGKDRDMADKEYDARVRQMLYDQRAKPTERTKTEEEKAKEEVERLKEQEEQRMRRMRGEPESEPEENTRVQEEDEDMRDDAAEFGFSNVQPGSRPEGVQDEDDFVMEDELVASDSEADVSDLSDDESVADDTMGMNDDDEEFLAHVLPEKAKPRATTKDTPGTKSVTASSKLAYTYPCPRSHAELLEVFREASSTDIPVIVQRIRALYHAGLAEDNKNKLADFACALVDHISYLSEREPVELTLIETLTRHIHSLSKSYPVQVATRFREHLKTLQSSNAPTPGNLTILTAIGSIYPTSDHFHQVVTPAITLMARWVGLSTPSSTKDVAIGAYICALCQQYQRLSKRYIPELVRYTILCLKSPHLTPELTKVHINNIFGLADLWSSTPAFIEIFTPFLAPLTSLRQTSSAQRLRILLQNARLHRRPQELHHHRPLPIKTSIPKFEESFDPNKHYDPDRERAEANKLQKEYKRERKGAMRELRKDANFIAREKLREKKDKDRKYEEKYKRLVAEIQGEEGREANAYEREKRARKRRG